MMRRCSGVRTNRAGLTRIDVAVIACILLVMAALLLPAIRTTRRPAQRVVCQCNMKQLVTATLNQATRHDGRLPDLYEESHSTSLGRSLAPWTVSLLNDLDNRQIRRTFDADPNSISGISLKCFQCPIDTNNFAVNGGLSYVANMGYVREDIFTRKAEGWQFAHTPLALDWTTDGRIDEADVEIAVSSGCFWPPVPNGEQPSPTWRPMTLNFIAQGDGQANTILFAENTQARSWHRANATHDFAFGVPVVPVEDFELGEPSRLKHQLSYAQRLQKLNALPSAASKAEPGTAQRPNSNHNGISIYGFADGSAKQISDQIDWLVYVRLLTPNGERYGQSRSNLDDY